MRILHVDDDGINLLVLEQMLSALGHAAVAVTSAAEALERLDQEAFDLVLADIHMPDVDGVEMLRRIRARTDAMRDIPVVAVTADVMTRREHHYRELGFAAVMAKPLLMPTLARVLASVSAPAGARGFASSGLGRGYSNEERAWLREGGALAGRPRAATPPPPRPSRKAR